ncbi:sulfur carrier protein ThiS [Marinobacter daqiaonensis]|uniref:Sulfur carrier protein ThiS n=1 Tax=Marinobacter daqiaonensis TaxID=650891 RepID=A0A1I6JSY4_9GAMM|nr:sulfur carrier protein ThiS [Marinobacter daqiaonensis]SFR82094.1 sulfur carrier protein ThiS [Marinobacter daqiaonensis]
MNVFINGEPRDIPDKSSLQTLIESLGLTGKRLAVEVNEDIVPRSQHSEFRLSENDRVEIVHAIGGG